MAITLTGRDGGEIVWGYAPAAGVASWSITAAGTTGTLTGTVIAPDTFRLQQQGLTFRVRRQNGHVWTWPITSLQIAGTALTASVTVQE